ncbi:hypothetical protein [uncultured Marinobacter sp.]|uniref:ComEC/Rec2 family competence protein n=1 Tax=uncultured Marinobacter sp. TaxID=187379 RepID=UPI0025EB63EB|nr:hypothetical protein [uncultured Marinobacter sp.]
MKLTIHDVGHGQCISLIHANGNVMLWDCGHDDEYRPSVFLPALGISRVDYFFVTNFDEDHLSDLHNLRDRVRLRSIFRNKSISADQLRALKREAGPISPAMQSMLDMLGKYTGGPLAPAPEFPNVRFRTFSNSFGTRFQDTNNISLVTFLTVHGTKFLIPGDLEVQGWEALLERPEFGAELADVDVFIASHHGRESGYCPEVFSHCTPSVVVISDSEIKHATQGMVNAYGNQSTGISFNGESRHVLTTRRDGTLTWNFE